MIRLRNLSRVFQVGDEEVRALDGVDLDVEPGEYISIMGPSGSGKSTLLNIIGLLDRPTSGTIALDGTDLGDLSDEEQARLRSDKIGFVFQFFHLVPRLDAVANLELPLVLSGVAPSIRRRRVNEVIEALHLEDRARHRPDQLSGGQRQRVAVGRAMVTKPRLILADEPTGNLDRASGRQIVDLLEALNRDTGVVLIVVTHDPELGARAHRRIRMVDGKIAADERVAS